MISARQRKLGQHIAFSLILTLSLAFPHVLFSQSSYKVDGVSEIDLKGTSTLRDWTMMAHSFTGSALFTFAPDHQLSSVTEFSLRLPVHNLRSESAETQKNAYKALKDDRYKDIVFDLTSAQFIQSGLANYLILLHGHLTIAGVTQPTTLKLSAAINEDGTILCSGSMPVLLSDYDIARPSFLLGAMKIGDVLTLTYRLLLVQ
ncbi:MAG: YceI family protein [Bacteroidota bacterium]|nr:YceI family protein [Bacteroidota bacterium]MDP4234158.1 YceI family protein [Bacteroidota bacterium]MDP4244020.1 YceI family protein [Bacteroidota bacterium]MDP4287858.1 YceI family protein [Bacteroidota bacterium]